MGAVWNAIERSDPRALDEALRSPEGREEARGRPFEAKTPLRRLFEDGNLRVLELAELLVPHSDLSEKSFPERPALVWAAARGASAQLLKTIFDAEPKAVEKDRENTEAMNTALFKAVMRDECGADAIRFLAPFYAGVRTSSGRTALIQAAIAMSSPEVAQALIEHGGDPLAADNTGKTALMWAAEQGPPEMVKVLLPVSAPQAKDQDGKTALHFAVSGVEHYALSDDELTRQARGEPVPDGILRLVKMLLPLSNPRARSKDAFIAVEDGKEAEAGAILLQKGHSAFLEAVWNENFGAAEFLSQFAEEDELEAALAVEDVREKLPKTAAELESLHIRRAMGAAAVSAFAAQPEGENFAGTRHPHGL